MKRRTFLAGLAAGSVASSVEARAQGTATPTPATNQTGGGGQSTPTTHTVEMVTTGSVERGHVFFDPIGLFVNPGDTVKWVLKNGSHSTTSYTPDNPGYSGDPLIPKGAKPWNSGVYKTAGKSFSYTFSQAGTYDYYCIPHKTLGMVGRIVCGKPGGPAEQTAIPNTDKPIGLMPPSDVIVKQGTVSFPYVPTTNHGGPPVLFWGGLTTFVATSVYLFGVYDQRTGRYDRLATDELGIDDGEDGP